MQYLYKSLCKPAPISSDSARILSFKLGTKKTTRFENTCCLTLFVKSNPELQLIGFKTL